jgi:hypothetical protein
MRVACAFRSGRICSAKTCEGLPRPRQCSSPCASRIRKRETMTRKIIDLPRCTVHKVRHLPDGKECVACEYDERFLHEPIPKNVHLDFKGWRFTFPFRCMCCAKEICILQFCFGRCCGICDTGRCRHFPRSRGSYSGPRELFDRNAVNFIPPERWLNPETGWKPRHGKPRVLPKPKPWVIFRREKRGERNYDDRTETKVVR